MKTDFTDFNEKLLGFYLGHVEDDDRTLIEDELLNSREKLAEFIALKRTFELDDLPLEPSRAFKSRLRREAEKKFVRENRGFLKIWIPVGAFALIVLVVFGVFKMKAHDSIKTIQSSPGISFDSGSDAAASLNIL
jgi:hypothetical protein